MDTETPCTDAQDAKLICPEFARHKAACNLDKAREAADSLEGSSASEGSVRARLYLDIASEWRSIAASF